MKQSVTQPEFVAACYPWLPGHIASGRTATWYVRPEVPVTEEQRKQWDYVEANMARHKKTPTTATPPSALSPAMRQYQQFKAKYPDFILLFRMGDFYETFFEDATFLSKLLGVTLTTRAVVGGEPIPMAGVPFHAVEGYLRKLIAAGRKVALCEQVEDAAAKGIVKREVTRLMSPDTLMAAQHDLVFASQAERQREQSDPSIGVAPAETVRHELIAVAGNTVETWRPTHETTTPAEASEGNSADVGASGDGIQRAEPRAEAVAEVEGGADREAGPAEDAGGMGATGVVPMMRLTLSPDSVEDYATFLRVKQLPHYRFVGRTAVFPVEYANRVVNTCVPKGEAADVDYEPLPSLFDYQVGISRLAIRKEKYAVFVDPGYGKTLIEGEFARHAARQLHRDKCVLIVAPLMVVPQAIEEYQKFYGESLPVRYIKANELEWWLTRGAEKIGITNYEALKETTPQGRLGALILDESSMLKSAYGKWGQTCIRLGKGLRWKLAATGTPAPNDRIEFANHAVFLDAFPTTNAFLARYFVNRGQTNNRWELKAHALRPFYRSLSHWSIFMTSPSTYGWKDNAGTLPPIHIHIHDVELSSAQRVAVQDRTGDLFGTNPGGITSRSILSQIAKGNIKGEQIETLKPSYIGRLVDSWPDESTIIWCRYNAEQETIEKVFGDKAISIKGSTKLPDRLRGIREFKDKYRCVLISKPAILGFGLNLQVATRHVFSGLEDSYEEFYQAVKRSNRVGSTRDLNVHIPITAVERPMVETVLAKAERVQSDAQEQERIFQQEMNYVAA